MKKYKVLSLAVSGRNNKIFRTGDTVLENNFPQGRAAELEKGKHLQLIGQSEEEPAKVPVDPSEEVPEVKETETAADADNEDVSRETSDGDQGEENEEDPGEDATGMDSISKKQIMNELKGKGIKFDPRASKEELYKLLAGID